MIYDINNKRWNSIIKLITDRGFNIYYILHYEHKLEFDVVDRYVRDYNVKLKSFKDPSAVSGLNSNGVQTPFGRNDGF